MKKQYYTGGINEVLDELNSRLEGLSSREAKARLEENGYNEVEASKGISKTTRFLNQLKSLMVATLALAAIISMVIGDYKSAAIIFFVIVMNGILGVMQEVKAEKAIDGLKKLSSPHCKVRRGGSVEVIEGRDLVVGDIVVLEAGDSVPGDIRLLKTSSFVVDESMLTGESIPVEKTSDKLLDKEYALGDFTNLVFSGTNITNGRAEGVVIATAMETEIGAIAKQLSSAEEKETPLQKKINNLGKFLTIAVVFMCLIIFGIGMLNGREVTDMFIMAVSLAVAAIPEGLTAIITIILALGIERMSKRGAIVKKLSSVETLGNVSVICTDKTGTLTMNKMTVVKSYTDFELLDHDINQKEISGSIAATVLEENIKENKVTTLEKMIKIMTLCNDASIENGKDIGDPTETSLLHFADQNNIDKLALESRENRIYDIPFDSTRKLMSSLNKGDGLNILNVKGAIDSVLAATSKILVDGTVREITKEDIQTIMKTNKQMADNALRVLAFAYKEVDLDISDFENTIKEDNLVFVGLVGIIDPARSEVKSSIEECTKCGIKTIMITGDHKDTAVAIGKSLNIYKNGDSVITGQMLNKMTDIELEEEIKNTTIFARVSPEHKLRIVNTLQKQGNIVAMTGDGVNDGPALKAADIGVGMGLVGTEVAKEASDLILSDDNFTTIEVAVKEGRTIYLNIKKAIEFLLTTHIGEILALLVATIFNWTILYPIHLLWVNLITDTLPALALGLEKNVDREELLSLNKSESFFDKELLIKIFTQGILKGSLVIGIFKLAESMYTGQVAITMTFVAMSLVQLAHSFTLRSKKTVLGKGFFGNKALNYGVLLTSILSISVVLIPGINSIFLTVPLNLTQWLITIFMSISIIPIIEILKKILN